MTKLEVVGLAGAYLWLWLGVLFGIFPAAHLNKNWETSIIGLVVVVGVTIVVGLSREKRTPKVEPIIPFVERLVAEPQPQPGGVVPAAPPTPRPREDDLIESKLLDVLSDAPWVLSKGSKFTVVKDPETGRTKVEYTQLDFELAPTPAAPPQAPEAPQRPKQREEDEIRNSPEGST